MPSRKDNQPDDGQGVEAGAADVVQRHMPSYGFKQIGEFRAQIANLNLGTLGAQPCQKLLQHPRTGRIERLDRPTVDDQL
jgi:hypothetical protein